MAMGDRDLVERVKSAIDIVEIAQAYFPLTKRGERFVALCPFHREKTPSFSIHPGRQIFHCFGCLKSGDVLTLVMEMDRLSFLEALNQLAERAGVPLPERRGGSTDGKRLRLYELMEHAASFYRESLHSPRAAIAREYLVRRGIGDRALDAFRVGYAPNEWRELTAAMKARGFTEEELLAVGLIKENEQGRRWDLLRHRVVIPILDTRGRVIAFGGRVLDDSEPKYVNSPETELFSKRSVLFGFDVARQSASSRGAFVVVEGYMDVISAHQRGIDTAVAALGTAFTHEHAQQMGRYVKRAILVFDADDGGVRATDRGVPILLAEGIDVTVVRLPNGQDPDDFLKDRDRAGFESYVDSHGEDLIDYLIRRARERHGAGPTGAARGAREVLEQVSRTTDEIQFDLFLRRTAQAFGVDESVLRRAGRVRREGTESEKFQAHHMAPSRARLRNWEQDEVFIVQASLSDAAVATQAVGALSEADFRDSGRRRVFLVIRDIVKGSQSPNPSVVLEMLKEDAAATAAIEAAFGRDFSVEESAECVIARIVERRDDDEYRRFREETRRSGPRDDDEELNRTLSQARRFLGKRYDSMKRATRKQTSEEEERPDSFEP